MTSVDGSGPAAVDAFSVRSSDGQTLTFVLERLDVTGGKPAAHLREHLASGEPIAVDYVVESGRNVALRYDDAP